MSHRLFEEKHHASIYQKFRLSPPEEMRELIMQYLDKKKGPPHELAVDLGCGTGQNTRLLAPCFQKVVGIDVSESQVEEARRVPGFANVSYREGTAEELPFPSGSVDLLTAASAAHWFDPEGFLKEAARVLKPRGCVALLDYTDNFSLHHGSCDDKLGILFAEVREVLKPYTSSRVAVSNSKLQDLFDAIPFPDKQRVESIPVKVKMSVKAVIGFMETFSMYQTYLKADPQAATALLKSTSKRFLEEMGVSSTDTELDVCMEYFCVLACKPQ